MGEVTFPKIRCAKCGTLISRMQYWNDPANDCQYLTVECHGDKETMAISAVEIMSVANYRDQVMSQEGVAFGVERLTTSEAA